MKESALQQIRGPGQLVLRTPELLNQVQGSAFKSPEREGSRRVCDQFTDSSLIGWRWLLRLQWVWGLCATVIIWWGFSLVAQLVKNLRAMRETWL